MPKLKRTDAQKEDGKLLGAILYLLEMEGISKSELFNRAGFKQTTPFRRWNHPDDFTLGELRRIARILRTSVEALVSGKVDSAHDKAS